MSDQADPLQIQPGQLVRRRSDSNGAAWGLVVGVILVGPMEALVRWRDASESR